MRISLPLLLWGSACQVLVPTPSDRPTTPREDGCDDPLIYFVDDDLDGFGDPDSAFESCAELPAGYAFDGTDCDDADPGTFPGAIEVCDEVDRDCDGLIDVDAIDAPVWHPDADGDGFADDRAANLVRACDAPDGFARGKAPFDCNDDADTTYPGAADAPCDGVDQDCSGEGEFTVAQIGGFTYPTLHDALVRAAVDDTVWVCAGEHPVPPTLHRDGLDLRGVGPSDEVVVRGVGGRLLEVRGDRLNLAHLTLTGGEAEAEDGGAVRAEVRVASLDDVRFLHNRADGRGGALYLQLTEDPDSVATLTGIEARYNRAGEDGGFAAVQVGGVSFLTATDLALHHNEAGRHGGALRVTGTGTTQDLILDGLVATDNVAGADGGTISLSAKRNAVILGEQVSIRGGRADRGGQIFLDAPVDGKLDLTDAVLSGGTANTAGGLIYHRGPGTLDSGLFDAILSRGTAPEGGLYYLDVQNTGHLDWLRATLRHGQAERGSALYVTGSSRPFDGKLDVVTIRDQRGGPAIQFDPDFALSVDASVSLTDGLIENNEGGGISVPSHVGVALTRTDAGAGERDNGSFDLRQGSSTFSWSASTTVSCRAGTCD